MNKPMASEVIDLIDYKKFFVGLFDNFVGNMTFTSFRGSIYVEMEGQEGYATLWKLKEDGTYAYVRGIVFPDSFGEHLWNVLVSEFKMKKAWISFYK